MSFKNTLQQKEVRREIKKNKKRQINKTHKDGNRATRRAKQREEWLSMDYKKEIISQIYDRLMHNEGILDENGKPFPVLDINQVDDCYVDLDTDGGKQIYFEYCISGKKYSVEISLDIEELI